MKKIFKYVLDDAYDQMIYIPLPATILSVEEQRNNIVLYSIVDPDENVPKVSVNVLVIETGESIRDSLDTYKFLGTIKLYNGERILYVFYRYADHIAGDMHKIPNVTVETLKSAFMEKNRDVVMA